MDISSLTTLVVKFLDKKVAGSFFVEKGVYASGFPDGKIWCLTNLRTFAQLSPQLQTLELRTSNSLHGHRHFSTES